VDGRFNYGWSGSDVSKIQAQISATPASPSIVQLEHDRHGRDYTLSLKAYNPSPVDLTGIYSASYLQSVSPNLALGLDCVLQRPIPNVAEAALSYLAKWSGAKKDWVATAQFQPAQGVIQSTYWQKLGERVEAAADLTIIPSLVPAERKALGTVGAKYDFRSATFRAQLDSRGRISALLEQRLTGNFAVLIAGEIDHYNVRIIESVCFSRSILTETPFAFFWHPTELKQVWCRCSDRYVDVYGGGSAKGGC
jgi:mitochondrial import receptor subunit TOM40